MLAAAQATCELSVVMPCLNEADTLATCIDKAMAAMRRAGIDGEVIVADNGSTDGSQDIALAHGARVVPVAERGYGAALMGGIAAARGTFILMGDADDSYDFGELPAFVEKLRQGADLVQGCRLPSGGGRVLPGAMPASHRWIGNPILSLIGRRWFWAPVHDVYCGMRAFRRDFYHSLDQRCTGMEFATEMIVKTSLRREARIAEVPITLHPDGRHSHPPHLRTFRDGWRTLRFFLLYSPRSLFLQPGLALIVLGVAGYAIALPGLTVGGVQFDAHTLLFATLAILLGVQAVIFAVFAKTFAVGEGLLPPDARLARLFRIVTLERAVAGAAVVFGAGLALLAAAVNQWRVAGFGDLDYAVTMRWVIPGAALTAIGFQAALAAFFLSLLQLRRR